MILLVGHWRNELILVMLGASMKINQLRNGLMNTYEQKFYLSSEVVSCLEHLMKVSNHSKERIIENSLN